MRHIGAPWLYAMLVRRGVEGRRAVNGVARGPRASAADKGRSGGLDRGPDLAGADRA